MKIEIIAVLNVFASIMSFCKLIILCLIFKVSSLIVSLVINRAEFINKKDTISFFIIFFIKYDNKSLKILDN